MSVSHGPLGRCFHANPPVARETLEMIRQLEDTGKVFVALAHDSFLVEPMPQYPDELNGWSQSAWNNDLQRILSHHHQS